MMLNIFSVAVIPIPQLRQLLSLLSSKVSETLVDKSMVFELGKTTDGNNGNRTLDTVDTNGKSSSVSCVLGIADSIGLLKSSTLLSHVASQEETASPESNDSVSLSSDPLLVVHISSQSRGGSEPCETGDGGNIDQDALACLLGAFSDLGAQLERVVGIEAHENALAFLLVDFLQRQIKGKRCGHVDEVR